MNPYLIAVGVIILILAVIVFTGAGRYVKTSLLIAKVSPYEQPGGGAGSIYVIGDSTGYGTGASRSEDSVMGRLGNAYTWYRIQNDSVNGRMIAGAQKAAVKLSGQYDVVVLQIGANDILSERPVEDIVGDMQMLIETVRPHASHTIILTSGNIGAVPMFEGEEAATYQTASRNYDSAMRTLVNQWQDVSFVSLYDEPDEDVFVSKPDTYIAADGLHPTSEGYGVWYDKALPYFEQVLEAR